jgi:hypothetical protein
MVSAEILFSFLFIKKSFQFSEIDSFLSKMIKFFHFIAFEISFSNFISGKNRHRDCSTASFAILFILSIFFSFRSLIIDLSLGRK